MLPKNELLVSGRHLLRDQVRDKEGDNAREKFNHLMLDSLKNDTETDTKSALASVSIR